MSEEESISYRPFWMGGPDRTEDVVLSSRSSPQRGQIMIKIEEENQELFQAARQHIPQQYGQKLVTMSDS